MFFGERNLIITTRQEQRDSIWKSFFYFQAQALNERESVFEKAFSFVFLHKIDKLVWFQFFIFDPKCNYFSNCILKFYFLILFFNFLIFYFIIFFFLTDNSSMFPIFLFRISLTFGQCSDWKGRITFFS